MSRWVPVEPYESDPYAEVINHLRFSSPMLRPLNDGRQVCTHPNAGRLELFPKHSGIRWVSPPSDGGSSNAVGHLTEAAVLQTFEDYFSRRLNNRSWTEEQDAEFASLTSQEYQAAPSAPISRPKLISVAVSLRPRTIDVSGPGKKFTGEVELRGDRPSVTSFFRCDRNVKIDPDRLAAERIRVSSVREQLGALDWRRSGDTIIDVYPAYYALPPRLPQSASPLCWFVRGRSADGQVRVRVYSWDDPPGKATDALLQPELDFFSRRVTFLIA